MSGAAALGLDGTPDAIGRIAVGGLASLRLLDAPTAAHIPYRPGVPLTGAVWRRGSRVR